MSLSCDQENFILSSYFGTLDMDMAQFNNYDIDSKIRRIVSTLKDISCSLVYCRSCRLTRVKTLHSRAIFTIVLKDWLMKWQGTGYITIKGQWKNELVNKCVTYYTAQHWRHYSIPCSRPQSAAPSPSYTNWIVNRAKLLPSKWSIANYLIAHSNACMQPITSIFYYLAISDINALPRSTGVLILQNHRLCSKGFLSDPSLTSVSVVLVTN